MTTTTAAPSRTAWLVPVVAAAAAVVAFTPTLQSQLRELSGSTPLAYAALVPVVALVLAWVRGRGPIDERHPGELLVGGALLLAAAVLVAEAPSRWPDRLDVLAIPVFVAGAVLVLAGRATSRHHLPSVAFLVLAWPTPYVVALVRWLTDFTALTTWAVRQIVRVVPAGSPVHSATGATFAVGHHPSFHIDIATSCSGIESAIGFLFVGTACVLVVEGARRRKLAWLACGLATSWLANVVRIVLLLTIGDLFGRHLAMDEVHPYLGIVMFNVAVLTMVLALRWFGLRPPALPDPARLSARIGSMALATVVVAAAVVGLADRRIASVEPTTPSRASSALALGGLAADWRVDTGRRLDWPERFFGDDATWTRYDVSGDDEATLHVDVLTIDDAAALRTLGLEAFFRVDGRRSSRTATRTLDGRRVQTIGSSGHPGAVRWFRKVRDTAGTHLEQVVVSSHDGRATLALARAVTDVNH